MIFQIEQVPVYFPFPTIYPEQYNYMVTIKHLLDTQGHCLIEMPCGTGKTISLLSITLSYQLHMRKKQTPFKIVYCSRTVQEIEKALNELKNLVNYIKSYVDFPYLGIGLASRPNLCINEIALAGNTNLICQRLTAEWAKNKCDFFDVATPVPDGVFSLEDMREYGKKHGTCPYYLSRQLITNADCVIYTYNYLIDPHIYDIVSRNIPKNTVVIFDEAHNIDNHCIESLSFEVHRHTTEKAGKAIAKIEKVLAKAKDEQKNILKTEYEKMKSGKIENNVDCIFPFDEKKDENFSENKKSFARSNDLVEISTPVPGNIRNAAHFMSVLKRIVEFFKTKLKTTHLTTESTNSFTNSIRQLALIDKKTLSFCSTRLSTMLKTLLIDNDEDVIALKTVCDATTIAALHTDGFSVIFEPFDAREPTKFNPKLFIQCLDSSIAIRRIFLYRNVIVTSGTLSPIEMYPKILDFCPKIVRELDASYDRNLISPLFVSKGNDQMSITNNVVSTAFSLRSDPSIVRNYGSLVLELSKVVPDGMVVFFPSYAYMEQIVSLWSESFFINEIKKQKLIFVESNFSETSIALKNYRKSVDCGRGAILFCIARGKVSEGVDFEDCYGRCVVVLGVPYQNTESVRLKKRMEFLNARFGISSLEFLKFDAMRQAGQCLGRVIRNKNDYGLMVLADKRFEVDLLPRWIKNLAEPGNMNVSVDMAVCVASRFFREMAQEMGGSECVWTADDIVKFEESKKL